jgi:hypothetical protein
MVEVISSGDGVGSPLGWLWQRMRPVLYEDHPTACNGIATRFEEYIRRQAKERVPLHRDEIRRVSLALRTAGAPIS